MHKFKHILSLRTGLLIFYLVVCFALFIFEMTSDSHNFITYVLFIIFGTLLFVFIVFGINCFKKISYNNYYKFYFIVVLIIGFIFVAIAPPFMGSDEKTHFLRIYEITEGHFLTQTNENDILSVMPRSLNKAYTGYDDENIPLKGSIKYSDIYSRVLIPLKRTELLNYCKCNLTNYSNAGLYSPFQYLIQVLGIMLGKIFDFGPIILLYLARIFNLLCFSFLTMLGIKLIPKFKFTSMLILLSPVVLVGATTVSADGFTTAIIFLFIAYIINLIYNKKTLKLKEQFLLGFIAFFLAMCKIVYFPLVLLILLIPQQCFDTQKSHIRFKTIVLLFSFITSFTWLYLANLFLDSYSTAYDLHKEFLFHHPIEYLLILLKTYLLQFDQIISNLFFGNQLYHGQLQVYPFFSFAYLAIIFLSLYSEKFDLKFSKNAKKLVLVIIILIIALISTALFIQSGLKPDSGVIKGVQARYFTPLLFLISIFINIKEVKCSKYLVFMLFCLLYLPTIFTIIVKFI